MIPGFGLLRRAITLVLCAGSFWAGMQFVRMQQVDACLDAGGAISDRGLCMKGEP